MGVRRRGGARLRLTARHVGELVEELQALLPGSRVKDVQGLPPRDLLIVLEPAAADAPPVFRLRLSAHPDAARLHLQQGRVHRHPGPIGPFFRRLAEELIGATLRRIEQVRGDRIALVELGDAPSGERRALVLECFGRHANLVLLGRGDVVLDVLIPPPAKKAKPRLAVGEPWEPPGGGAAPKDRDQPGIAETLDEPEEAPPGKANRAPLSWRVEVELGATAEDSQRESDRKRLAARTTRKLSRARSLVHGLEQRVDASDRAERVRQDGELLKGQLGALARGMESIEVDDFFTDGAPKRVIALDKKLMPHENVERLFARYKKLERAKATVEAELARAREKVAKLEALAEAAADPESDAAALDDDAVAAGLLDPRQEADERKRKAPAPRLPYRSFQGSRGSEIRVGRSARDNDTLTLRHARGNDLWLHTAECPGSHVVLRLERNQEPDEEEILDAAHLAVHFSPARGTDRAPIHVARRKHVHKPRGAKAGLVTLSGGRILEVRVQQQRLEALLRAARGRGEE